MKEKKTHLFVGYRNISYICSEININKKTIVIIVPVLEKVNIKLNKNPYKFVYRDFLYLKTGCV